MSELEQGFVGDRTTDGTPNANYGVSGVNASEPTPETDAEYRALRESMAPGAARDAALRELTESWGEE